MNDKKKYAIVIPSLSMGGAERVASELANEMIKRNIDVQFVLLDNDDVYYKLDKRIDVTFIDYDKNKNKISRNCFRIKKIRHFLKENSIDIVISFLTSANFMSILSTMNTKIKVFVSERSNPNVDRKSIKIIRNILYRMADGCVFQTKEALNIFKGKIRKRSVVIENPIKKGLPQWIDVKKHNEDIVIACRLEKSKNIPMLLDAFSTVKDYNNNCKLLIFGDGPEKYNIQKLVDEKHLRKNVLLMGKDVNWHKKAVNSTVFVLSSDYEGMSNSLLEALSMGMPVVSTDHPIGGARALIEDKKNGFLVPIKDSEKMSKRIIEIMDSKKLQINFSKEAIKVNEKLSVERIADKWLDFVNNK